MTLTATDTRPASSTDNEALLALADSCPMHGTISLHIDRRPDFFAFSALEDDGSAIEVVDGEDSLAGCIAVSSRTLWFNGAETRVAYVGDLKVHPTYRHRRVADMLTHRAAELSASIVGESGMVVCSTLAGNRAMERRAAGGGDRHELRRIATVRAHAIPLLFHPGLRPWRSSLRVTHATLEDVGEMADVWNVVAPMRQFAPVLDADDFARWLRVPGVSYRLARARNGRLAGFIALWDQSDIRQLRVLRYSPSLARVRTLYNLSAPLLGASRLPRVGGALRHMETLHLCVRPSDANALRTLAVATHRELRHQGLAFFTISLDARDPLARGLGGLWAQPTDLDVRVSSPSGGYAGRLPDSRPVHYETALV